MSSKKIQTNTAQFENTPEDIIRIASYHRRDYTLAVIRINPSDHKQVRSSICQPFGAPFTSLRRLGRLPLETVHEICLHLDIQSLFQLRQVSRRTQQIVSTTRGYQQTTTHALDALCVILRTKIASHFTLSELLKVLCTRDCLLCGAFGGFIFLPSLLRCCFSCIRNGDLPLVISVTDAKKRFRLMSPALRSIPALQTIPGMYSMGERARKKKMQLVAVDDVIRISEARSDNDRAQGTRPRESPLLPFMVTTALPYLDVASGSIQNGVCCSGCQLFLEDALMTSTLPGDAVDLRDKVYSDDEFLIHFRQCQKAQELMRLSQEGTSAANLSEFVRRRGYFKKRDVILTFHNLRR
ncbi:F-box protein [Aspergillus ibericus CBS 121593]|uniref:F-box domain-containing protein n=1 Tax=Aspergillus ibericus CBS 121593 TaxID=1448316 RepID=A0A395H6W9_9EURO|nr:hypothetical protein BO80DRAFT_442771 [Aspergillus ibericus CBS 121593]RAL03657.1 hypothetical protein BO80DRAFT_442771 [Aspergillus ibericus CBS 121593]